MIELEREIQDNNRYLDEARRNSDRAAHSIDGFGKEVEQADNSMGDYSKTLSGFIDDLGKIKGAIIGGAAVGAIKELGSSILELEESTREYRSIMGTLAVSSQEAGYTAEETAAIYERLQGVLGDSQAAATTAANLQAIGLEQADLIKITDLAVGAWATYGDSIPIDGLAEAINETIQAGQVTGTFADVLNWAGESEDAFNERLEKANGSTERANIVLEALSQQGLADAADGWYQTNKEIIEANRSEEELRQAWAELSTVLAPVANWIRGTLAGSVVWLTEKVSEAMDGLQKLKDWANGAKGVISDAGGWGGILEDALSGKTAAELEAEAAAARATKGLTGAELRERGITSSDIDRAAATISGGYASAGESRRGGDHFTATVTLATEDGRNLGQYVTPFVNEENAANPPVRSDTF